MYNLIYSMYNLKSNWNKLLHMRGQIIYVNFF